MNEPVLETKVKDGTLIVAIVENKRIVVWFRQYFFGDCLKFFFVWYVVSLTEFWCFVSYISFVFCLSFVSFWIEHYRDFILGCLWLFSAVDFECIVSSLFCHSTFGFLRWNYYAFSGRRWMLCYKDRTRKKVNRFWQNGENTKQNLDVKVNSKKSHSL